MTFTEKLKRRAAEVNKARVGQAAGLGPTTISNYIAKGSIPRADIALKIARALRVPLDWLLDDSCDWPPPALAGKSLHDFSDEDIREEARRRLAIASIDLRDALARAEKLDWVVIAEKLSGAEGKKIPADVTEAIAAEESVEARKYKVNLFDLEREGNEFWLGPEVDPAERDQLPIDELLTRYRALASTAYGKFRHLLFLRLMDLSDGPTAEYARKQAREIHEELRKKKK